MCWSGLGKRMPTASNSCDRYWSYEIFPIAINTIAPIIAETATAIVPYAVMLRCM